MFPTSQSIGVAGDGTMDDGTETMDDGFGTTDDGTGTMDDGFRTMDGGTGTTDDGFGMMECPSCLLSVPPPPRRKNAWLIIVSAFQ